MSYASKLLMHLAVTFFFFFAKIVRHVTEFIKFDIHITYFTKFLIKIQVAWLELLFSVCRSIKNGHLDVEIRGKTFCHQCTLTLCSNGFLVLISASRLCSLCSDVYQVSKG